MSNQKLISNIDLNNTYILASDSNYEMLLKYCNYDAVSLNKDGKLYSEYNWLFIDTPTPDKKDLRVITATHMSPSSSMKEIFINENNDFEYYTRKSKVEYTQAEVFTVRNQDGMPVMFTIESEDKWMNFQVSGDLGNFSYFWSSMGTDYKSFLKKTNFDYFIKKLFGKEAYIINNSKTLDKIKNEITELYIELKCSNEYTSTLNIIEENYSDSMELIEESQNYEHFQFLVYERNYFFTQYIEEYDHLLVYETNPVAIEIWDLLQEVIFYFKSEEDEIKFLSGDYIAIEEYDTDRDDYYRKVEKPDFFNKKYFLIHNKDKLILDKFLTDPSNIQVYSFDAEEAKSECETDMYSNGFLENYNEEFYYFLEDKTCEYCTSFHSYMRSDSAGCSECTNKDSLLSGYEFLPLSSGCPLWKKI